MPADGSQRAARRPPRPRQDASRWIFGLVITAVVASAATSAVFLAIRPQPIAPDPLAVQLDLAEAEMQSLAPALKALVVEQLAADQASGDGPVAVDVRYSEGMPEQAASVPMVSVDDQLLSVGWITPWRLDAVGTQHRREFSRILDIRRSASVARPGYIGVVELTVTRLTGDGSAGGHLPFDPPSGYQVVTQAEYTELEQSKKYAQQVSPAALTTESVSFHYDRWNPAQPPPEELPPCVREQFHEAIVQCTAAPEETTGTQTVTFFYPLRDGKWIAQP